MSSDCSKLVNFIRAQGAVYNPDGIELGTVVTSTPLSVIVGDLPLLKDNLLIADYLNTNYTRKMTVPITPASGSVSCSDGGGSISNISIPNADITFTDTLKKDDTLALIKMSKSLYLILCKVVKP